MKKSLKKEVSLGFNGINDVKVGVKLTGGFMLVVVLLIAVAGVGYANMQKISSVLNAMYNDRLLPVQTMGNINTHLYQIRGDIYKMVAIPGDADKLAKSIADEGNLVDQGLSEMSKTEMSDAEATELAALQKSWPEYKGIIADMVALVKAGKTQEALSNLAAGKATPSRTAVDTACQNLSDLEKKDAENLNKLGTATSTNAAAVSAIVALIAVVLSIGVTVLLTRSITGPLAKAVRLMKELGQGHLGERLRMRRRDEIGQLVQTMDNFAADLQHTVIGTMKQISNGDLSAEIVPKDERDEIGPALRNTIDSLRGLVADMTKVYEEQKAGDMDYYADSAGYQGAYRELSQGYNAAIKLHVDNILLILSILTSYAEGDFAPVLKKLPGKQAIANEKMDLLRNNLTNLIAEAEMLTRSAAAGDLATRGDAAKFKGDYIQIIKGFNDTLDNIVVPLSEAHEVLNRESRDDLTQHVRGDYQGELSRLKESINMALDSRISVVLKLKKVSLDLAESSSQLTLASEQAGLATQQIATASQQVAKGASDQADALQNATRAVDELSRVIDQIAQGAQEQARMIEKNVQVVSQISTAIAQVSESAQQAAAGARSASNSAQKGADMSHETVKGMESVKKTMDTASVKVNGLGERSKEIGKIVAAIDDIADQTNLLALNAAVEAARAGEQGRGFAVVADEVRKLAERSQEATKEIAELIGGIQTGVAETVAAMEKGVSEVDNGYALATKAGSSLEDIVKRAKEMGLQVEQISSAAEELTAMSSEMVKLSDNISAIVEENTAATEQMAATAKQVSRSVESVAGVAEENSAASEEVSAAAEEITAQMHEVVNLGSSLSAMASDFQKLIANYRVNGNGSRDSSAASSMAESIQYN